MKAEKKNLPVPVDIVIPWVDGSDPEWIKERLAYMPSERITGAKEIRFRDWGLLRFLFRGFEKNMSWVHRIFFVTWGHFPDWLNADHPKLRIVNHRDYIPERYLPTFSSHTIELNLYRIPDLSEHFIYFNDDFYPIRPVPSTYFFKNGKARDYAIQNPRVIEFRDNFFIPMVNDSVINHHFKKKEVVRRHRGKWYHPCYGIFNILNFFFNRWSIFIGFFDGHLPIAYTKSQFKEVWEAEPELLDETCSHRFRENTDVNQWLVRYWRLCKGDFIPRACDPFRGYQSFVTGDEEAVEQCVRIIRNQSVPFLCINDGDELQDLAKAKEALEKAFLEIFPEKSSFEVS